MFIKYKKYPRKNQPYKIFFLEKKNMNNIKNVKDYDTLEDTVRTSFAAVVWSHKIQEKQAEIYASSFTRMQTINTIAAALTSAGLCGIVFTDPFWLKLASTLLSFISTLISVYCNVFDLKKNSDLHKETANKFLYSRDCYKFLLMEIKLRRRSVESLVQEYRQLLKKTSEIYDNAPNTTDEAVDLARVSLKINKDNSFTNNEIDMFLPNSLKRERL